MYQIEQKLNDYDEYKNKLLQDKDLIQIEFKNLG